MPGHTFVVPVIVAGNGLILIIALLAMVSVQPVVVFVATTIRVPADTCSPEIQACACA